MTDHPSVRHEIHPAVSVVLVTHNAWRLTAVALQALRDHTDEPHELIVVDNASTDETPAALSMLEDAHVIRNPVNAGFGAAGNQGASVARAPYVAFVNTDAFVHEGWVTPLLEVVREEADVAVVGARLLHPDGRLQEAGSVVWREGMVDNYGDGENADDPHYLFRRDVDYTSAACVLYRRSAFLEAGGFDTVFAPAYFEDTDLCFRLLDRGWRCVYQPRSVATHVRWGSGSQEATAQLYRRNLPIFAERWAHRLQSRPPRPLGPGDGDALLVARDAMTAERVLVISDRVPAPDHRWGRILSAMAYLWPGARTTLLTTRDAHEGGAAAAHLRRWGVEVMPVGADAEGWLATRSGHYTAVITRQSCPPPPGVEDALVATQPAVVRVHDLEGEAAGVEVERLTAVPSRAAELLVCADAADERIAEVMAPGAAIVSLPGAGTGVDAWESRLIELASHLGLAPPPPARLRGLGSQRTGPAVPTFEALGTGAVRKG